MSPPETPTSAKSSRVERTRTDGRDGRAPGLATTGAPAVVCNDHHIFHRDAFAGLPKAEVWCDKPTEHAGPHEGVRGTMAFAWGGNDDA